MFNFLSKQLTSRMKSGKKMELLNRELSWLSFNERVLQEAMDETVPLVERIRFLGIYSNNLDEFFRVRVANVKRIISIQKNSVPGFSGTANELLDAIRARVIEQQKTFEKTYLFLVEALKKHHIFQLNELNLSEEHQKKIQSYFQEVLKHVIVPIILDPKNPFPKLRDKSIYLAIQIESNTHDKLIYGLIEVPSNFPRFYTFESEQQNYFILVDDIIRLNLKSIFSLFDPKKMEAFTFKFSRDAELNLDDDLSVSFIDKIEKSIKQRKKGEPVRFVYDHRMPTNLRNYLLKALNLKKGANAIPGGKYHNFKDFRRFPDFNKKELVYENVVPEKSPDLENCTRLIHRIYEKDVLLHFPYQRFDYVVDLLREAALDPKVSSIKMNVYRVAEDSQVMNALMSAVSNGKDVLVIVELQARFDEENNLKWAERLQEHGARVIYGFQGFKVHAKMILIKRRSKEKDSYLSYIGTGNFHEKTAKIYSDIGLLTANSGITQEVRKVFRLLENNIERGIYKYLLVSPFNNRRKITNLILAEVENAKKGIPASIRIKMNNLVDEKIIQSLYKASNAGVKIQLIIRGVCCLVPNVKGQSENIEVISIVDRFLEHIRFLIFENGGKPLYYLTSADLMERNLDKRIEVGAPILDPAIQQEIQTIFDLQWKDTQKARIVDKKQKNAYRKVIDQKPFRSQYALMAYYKEKNHSN